MRGWQKASDHVPVMVELDDLKVALLRHGPTAWNALGRIQGHTDIPLSEEGLRKDARAVAAAAFRSRARFRQSADAGAPDRRGAGLDGPVWMRG